MVWLVPSAPRAPSTSPGTASGCSTFGQGSLPPPPSPKGTLKFADVSLDILGRVVYESSYTIEHRPVAHLEHNVEGALEKLKICVEGVLDVFAQALKKQKF